MEKSIAYSLQVSYLKEMLFDFEAPSFPSFYKAELILSLDNLIFQAQ